LPRSKRIKQRWAARPQPGGGGCPASTRPGTRAAAKSQGRQARSASPTAPPRAPSANANKRSVGSATARNGGPAARVASAWSNDGTDWVAAGTRGIPVSSVWVGLGVICRQPGQHQPASWPSSPAGNPNPQSQSHSHSLHTLPAAICRRGPRAQLRLHGRPKTAFLRRKVARGVRFWNTRRGTRTTPRYSPISTPELHRPGAKSSATSSCEHRKIGLAGRPAFGEASFQHEIGRRRRQRSSPRATEAEISQALLSATICRAIAADSSSSTTGVRSTSR